ncbi:lipid II flippase MurJ [Edaphobacter acidisoli]|uniref:Lipid II flippase MurJ n=1 Tax=Edaphobacter acidisoli TaxID=2040573 RepID=A0A916RTP0_9BACT|nr:lipid II flippase MurJ [Edaphobacter acidisoli]GGA69219.1 lipid II flippase MurJ [Edaphobacter acidisoli]
MPSTPDSNTTPQNGPELEPELTPEPTPEAAIQNIPTPSQGLFSWLRPSAKHSAYSATLLIMVSTLCSGVLGLVKLKILNHIFGAGPQADAYYAAFELPDMLAYFLVGGVASISLVTILDRYRAAGDEEGGDRAISAVLNAMIIVFGAAVLLAEFFAPIYVHWKFHGFPPAKAALTTSLTRLLLPAQLFFFIGGVIGSKLLVRKIFIYQAITPLIYNLGIIFGAVFLARRFGIYSLAIGVLAGVILGPAALNAFGARRIGLRYYPIFNLRHPAFIEWLKLSLPLMIGVSLVTADKWILSTFASFDNGGVTHLNVAKALFNAPMGILGQAAGAASLPFFSTLFSQRRLGDFSGAVNRAVSRVFCASLIAAAWMIALAAPIVDLFRGGHYSRLDAADTAQYFAIFAITLALWTSQGIYARAFYAARNTLTPAVAGSIITLVSIPIYRYFFHSVGMAGLAIASDVGIVTQTVTLAVLLHRRKLVPITGLEGGELARSLLAALISFAGVTAVVRYVHVSHGHLGNLLIIVAHSVHVPRAYLGDALIIAAASVVWAALSWGALMLTGSKLPRQLLSRR